MAAILPSVHGLPIPSGSEICRCVRLLADERVPRGYALVTGGTPDGVAVRVAIDPACPCHGIIVKFERLPGPVSVAQHPAQCSYEPGPGVK